MHSKTGRASKTGETVYTPTLSERRWTRNRDER
jgi:hypothetical protein